MPQTTEILRQMSFYTGERLGGSKNPLCFVKIRGEKSLKTVNFPIDICLAYTELSIRQ